MRSGIWPGTVLVAVLAAGSVSMAAAQTPEVPATERLTFDEAIRRATTANPSVARAAAGILRAESIRTQVRSGYLPNADFSVVTTTVTPVPDLDGTSIVPSAQANLSLGLNVPLIEPVKWAARAQAEDQIKVAGRAAEDVRRQIAIATASAYLSLIAQHRVVELNERARDTARAHYDYATQRFEGGMGSRLNQLRAQQELSSNEVRVEDARLAVRRAQEALGVLVAADGPVDVASEPAFEVPQEAPDSDVMTNRADLRLAVARETAAERVVHDSWREYLPTVSGRVAPELLAPSGLFAHAHTFSSQLLFSVPLFDLGERRGRKLERQSLFDVTRADRAELERETRAEVRTAREAVGSTERAVTSARAAAAQAAEVLRITDVAFRAGVTTNIEVIDAQRAARDSETEAVIAEDALRRSRLELLVALGRFPQ